MTALRSIPARIESIEIARKALASVRALTASQRIEHELRIDQAIDFLRRCEAAKGAVNDALIRHETGLS